MRWRNNTLNAILLALGTSLQAAPALETPVAMVVASEGEARLHRGQLRISLRLHPGMIILSGDRIEQRNGTSEIAYCRGGRGDLVRLASASEYVFPGEFRKIGTVVRPLDICRLPRLERFPEPRNFAGFPLGAPPNKREDRIEQLAMPGKLALREQLGRTKQLALPPLVEALAIAEAYVDAGLTIDALEEYSRIRDRWPEADWTRQVITRLRETELMQASPLASGNRNGKAYGFLMGVSEFRAGAIPKLRFAERDAGAFASYLQSERAGSLSQRNRNLWVLTGAAATRDRVTEEIAALLRTAGRSGKSTVFLYFATHGFYSCGGKLRQDPESFCRAGDREDVFLLTHDSDPEDLALTAIRLSDLHDLVTAHAQQIGQVFLILDICHGGTLAALPLDAAVSPSDLTDNFEARSDGGSGLLLASDRQPFRKRSSEIANEYSALGGGHGAFTYYVVQGLSGGVQPLKSSTLVLEDLMAYVRNQVRAWTGGKQNPTYRATTPGMVVVADTRIPSNVSGFGQVERLDPVPEVAKAEEEPPAVRLTRAQFQQQGQTGILRYLQGEQAAQTKRDFQECSTAFGEAQQTARDSAFTESRLLFCRGRALLFQKERREEALLLLERSARIDPARGYAYNALGIGFLEMSRFEDAKAAFLDAIARAPNWAYPVHNLALTEEQSGNYARAIELYQQASSMAHGASYPAYNLGLLFQRLNRVEESRRMYRSAIDNGRKHGDWPHLAEAYNALGTLEAAVRRTGAAQANYEEALHLEPGLESARHNLALLEATQLKRFESAEARWRALIASGDPAIRTPARYALGQQLALRGRRAEAVDQLQALLNDAPRHSSARRALVLLHAAMGEIETAIRTASAGDDETLNDLRIGLRAWMDGRMPQEPELRAIYRKRMKGRTGG